MKEGGCASGGVRTYPIRISTTSVLGCLPFHRFLKRKATTNISRSFNFAAIRGMQVFTCWKSSKKPEAFVADFALAGEVLGLAST